MLSIFPEILFLSPFAALFIRAAVGLVFTYCAWDHLKENDGVARSLGVLEIVLGAAFFAGAWTQALALVGAIVMGIFLWQPTRRPIALGTALLTLVMCLSLLVTGAGPFAFDLPL